VTAGWDPAAAGVLRLPSGRLVRGRALARPGPAGPSPAWGLYLLGHEPPAVAWEAVRYVRAHYAARAVETPGQRRFVARFPPGQ
jgi:hypothetical protein